MNLAYYFLIIPSGLSFVGCSIFLYFYLRHSSIRQTFGMKYIAILQSADLIVSIVQITPIQLYAPKNTVCPIMGCSFNFFLLFQTYWVAVISRYNYQVLCLGIEKEKISLSRYFIFGIIISVVPCIITVSFSCYKLIGNFCNVACSDTIRPANYALNSFIILISWAVSVYSSVVLVIKLRKKIKSSSTRMNFTFLRLLIYPFITFILTFPASFTFLYYSSTESEDIITIVIVGSLVFLIGFFNSIALGFTPEFREALKFSNKEKSRPLIN